MYQKNPMFSNTYLTVEKACYTKVTCLTSMRHTLCVTSVPLRSKQRSARTQCLTHQVLTTVIIEERSPTQELKTKISISLANLSGLKHQKYCPGISLAVQCLRLGAPNAEGKGSISGLGTKTPHAAQLGPKNKEKK